MAARPGKWPNVNATCIFLVHVMPRASTIEETAERRRLVLAMYIQGHTYRHIGRTLKISATTVSNDLRKITKKLEEGKLKEVIEERRTQTYDMVLDTLRQIRDTHLKRQKNVGSAKVAVLATDRISKLLGFNAPEQFIVQSTNKQDGPVELVVKGVRAKPKPTPAAPSADSVGATDANDA